MNPGLIKAVIVVTCALIFYSVGVIKEQRSKAISRFVLFFLTGGVVLDITSTTLMIINSGNIPITPHGMLGYSALLVMLVDAVLVWRFWLKNHTPDVPHRLHLYTRFAYIWWVLAYIAGAIIANVI
jgi:uncharacterized repeat protein (TIGR03987 family)